MSGSEQRRYSSAQRQVPLTPPQLGVPEEGGSHRSDLAEYYGRGGGDPKPEELSRQPWQLSGGILTLYYAWDHLKLGLVLV